MHGSPRTDALVAAPLTDHEGERGPFDVVVNERATLEMARFGGDPGRRWLRDVAAGRVAAAPTLVAAAVAALALNDGLTVDELRAIAAKVGDHSPGPAVRLALGDETLLSADLFKNELAARLALKGIERLEGRAGLELLGEQDGGDPELLADAVRTAERITGQRFFVEGDPSPHSAAMHMRNWYEKHGATFVAKRRRGK